MALETYLYYVLALLSSFVYFALVLIIIHACMNEIKWGWKDWYFLHRDSCRECPHWYMDHQTLTMNANKTKFLLTRVGAMIANNGQ